MFSFNDPTPATEIKYEHTTNSLPRRNTMTRSLTTLRTLCAMMVIAGVALFTGCGTNMSPLAPEQPATISNDSQVIVRSAKRAKGGGSKTTKGGGKKKGGPAQFGGGE